MPISLPRFMHQPDENIPDILGNYMRGYSLAGQPAAMRRQEEQERLANALKGLEYQFAPQQYEQEAEKRALSNAFQSRENEAQPEDIRLRQLNDALKAQGQHLSHDQLRMALKHMPQEYELAQQLKQAQIASALGKAQQYYPREQGEHVSFDQLSKPEQFDVSKRMRNDLRSAEDVYKADRTLDEMKKIMESYPELSDTLSNILIDPKSSSIKAKIARSLINKKDRAAIEKFTKLSNDLVLQAGTALGSKNFTDAKLRVLETAKPTSLNSTEANLFLINKMKEEFSPWKDYASELKKGLKDRYVVEYDLDKYRKPHEEEPIKYANRSFKVFNNETGQEEYLTEEEAIAEGLI